MGCGAPRQSRGRAGPPGRWSKKPGIRPASRTSRGRGTIHGSRATRAGRQIHVPTRRRAGPRRSARRDWCGADDQHAARRQPTCVRGTRPRAAAATLGRQVRGRRGDRGARSDRRGRGDDASRARSTPPVVSSVEPAWRPAADRSDGDCARARALTAGERLEPVEMTSARAAKCVVRPDPSPSSAVAPAGASSRNDSHRWRPPARAHAVPFQHRVVDAPIRQRPARWPGRPDPRRPPRNRARCQR